MRIDTLEALMTEELKDVYDAEKQITKALPKMVKAVESAELKEALQEHLEVTKKQVERLDQVFQMLGKPAKGKHCAGMAGLLEEGDEVAKRDSDENLGDAGIIGAAQKVEHYEIAAYGTLKTFAEKLGLHDIASLLEQTLEEEKEADQKLTQVSEQLLAQTAGSDDEETDIEEEDELDEDDELDDEEDIDEEDMEEGASDEEDEAPVKRKAPAPVATKAPKTGTRKK